MTTDTFSHWFKRQLQRRGWSQADFHRESGVPKATVSTWVRGVRVPEPDKCDVIAETFGVDRDYVLDAAGHRPRATDHRDKEREDLAAMLKKIKLDGPDRALKVGTLRNVMQTMIDVDRAATRRSEEGE